MKTTLAAFAIVLCFALSGVARAADITYNVNRPIGAGSVIGTIETDGTIGVLNSSNVKDWSLTLTYPGLDGGSPQLITFATRIVSFISGNATTATPTDLLFNFSGVGFLVFSSAPHSSYYCLDTGGAGGCSPSPVEALGLVSNNVVGISERGLVTFATVAAVPEPVSYAMLLAGLGVLVIVLGRKRK
jgi:hypothetical protein